MDHRDIVDYSLLFIGNIPRSVLPESEWTVTIALFCVFLMKNGRNTQKDIT